MPADNAESISGSPRSPHCLEILRAMVSLSRPAAFSRQMAARSTRRLKSDMRCVQFAQT